MRVLQFSSHNEECGIAKYQEQFIAGMSGVEDFYTEFFAHSPYKTRHMSKAEFKVVLDELKQKMADFDILHIQFELSFFRHTELEDITNLFTGTTKKIIVTAHTAPHAWYKKAKLGGLGLRSFAQYARDDVSESRFIKRYIKPLNKVDLIVAHNNQTISSLKELGITHDRFKLIKIPVPKLPEVGNSTEISKRLRSTKEDIIFCTIGFLSRMKGIDHAVKALTYLPQNYKLAIIGGNHPTTQDSEFYDVICDLIYDLKLQDRVYITGYVEEDGRLNALIRETDICVFPYDPSYYSYVSSASLQDSAHQLHKRAVIKYPVH